MKNFQGEITFFDIFTHLDRESVSSRSFVSNYWTILVEKLYQLNKKVNWLHNYHGHYATPTLTDAQRLNNCFDATSEQMQFHSLMEGNFRLPVFFKAYLDYLKLLLIAYQISIARYKFYPKNSSMNLWHLFDKEWNSSLFGKDAMMNCLCFCLYENTLRELPHQKIGIYIQENQPWEICLIYAWSAAGHGRLIGAPHSNVRYWDLRYFFDPRTLNNDRIYNLPVPDKIAVNSPIAKKLLIDNGYLKENIIEVEALRFIYLSTRINRKQSINKKKVLTILICGDFLMKTNYKLLDLISKANKYLPENVSFLFKPHPTLPLNENNLFSLKYEITNTSLNELFDKCDVVFTSNITSAAIDSFCYGVPVVQMLDGKMFNMSPLRGLKDVNYVTNPKTLAAALMNPVIPGENMTETLFYMDMELPRWRQLLQI